MGSRGVFRRMFCAAAEAAAAPVRVSRWERLKNSRAGVWCRSLASDYKEACREMVVGAWERPVKASVYGALLGGALTCFYTKPDRASFEAALLDRSNQLGLLSPWIRNAVADGHVQTLVKLRNEGRLQHVSLGLLTLVYRADFDPDAMLYEAQCSNLSVPWRELPRRVLDVGFGGSWWVLDFKMRDYDVNEAEFKHLPAHMQNTAPPGVREVETSERLHKESWLPLTVEEEEAETEVKGGAVGRPEEEAETEVMGGAGGRPEEGAETEVMGGAGGRAEEEAETEVMGGAGGRAEEEAETEVMGGAGSRPEEGAETEVMGRAGGRPEEATPPEAQAEELQAAA